MENKSANAQRKEFRVLAPEPFEVDEWLYISMSVSAQGQVSLYNEGTLLVSATAPSNATKSPASKMATAPIGYLELGGNGFQGRIRNLLISDVAKGSPSDPNVFAKSM